MNPRLLNMLPQAGVYTLIIHLLANTRLKVGKLGEHQFPRGHYVYTGSALGLGPSNLRKRVARHLQEEKHKFWHIDYLLIRKDAVVVAIIAAQTNKKVECEISKCFKNEITARIPVLNLGASGCKENCGSHLLYFGEKRVIQKIASLYSRNFGSKTVIVNFRQSQIHLCQT